MKDKATGVMVQSANLVVAVNQPPTPKACASCTPFSVQTPEGDLQAGAVVTFHSELGAFEDTQYPLYWRSVRAQGARLGPQNGTRGMSHGV